MYYIPGNCEHYYLILKIFLPFSLHALSNKNYNYAAKFKFCLVLNFSKIFQHIERLLCIPFKCFHIQINAGASTA